jgi:hypothetical protein
VCVCEYRSRNVFTRNSGSMSSAENCVF